MKERGDLAVSEVIGYIMILMIVTTTMSLLFFWFDPFVERTKMESQANNVCQQLRELYDQINTVVGQGSNSSATVDITVEKGSININEEGERIVVWYSYYDTYLGTNYEFHVEGLDDGDHLFDIRMESNNINCKADIFWLDDDESQVSTGSQLVQTSYSLPRFDATKNIENMVVINLTDIKGAGDADDILFGRIWIFDTGCISYDLQSGFGTYRTLIENNGMILAFPNSEYLLKKEPVIFEEYDDFVLRIFQVKQNDTRAASGGGTGKIRVYVKSNETTAGRRIAGSFIRQNRNVTAHHLKMQIFNLNGYETDVKAWKLHFINNYRFTGSLSKPTMEYEPLNANTFRFTLIQSVFEAGIEVIQ